MRLCKICGQTKPYDPSAPRESKEMGFIGYTCYACHRLKVNLKRVGLCITDPDAPAKRLQRKAQQKQTGIKIMSKPYGEMLLDAQSTLDSWLKANTEPYTYSQSSMRDSLQYKLDYAKRRVAQFGATAYDYKALRPAKSYVD